MTETIDEVITRLRDIEDMKWRFNKEIDRTIEELKKIIKEDLK